MHTIKLLLTYYLNISVQAANLSGCRIESNRKNRFGSENRIETFLPELECSSHESSFETKAVATAGGCHRSGIRILRILSIFKIHEFYWISKMLTEFYFEIQYFNLDWKITFTLLHGRRNTQQRQVRLRSVSFRVRISNSPLFPFNSCFNIFHNLNVLQFNHKTYQ